MKPLPYTTDAVKHAYMRKRQSQNRVSCLNSTAETWMADKLATTSHTWTRQGQWGFRLFDFWCHELGVAIEVDGPEHDAARDRYRDEYNFRRSAIVVLRVKNLCEQDAAKSLALLSLLGTWADRQELLKISQERYTQEEIRKRLALIPEDRDTLQEYLAAIASGQPWAMHIDMPLFAAQE